jgi:hypothetical protein
MNNFAYSMQPKTSKKSAYLDAIFGEELVETPWISTIVLAGRGHLMNDCVVGVRPRAPTSHGRQGRPPCTEQKTFDFGFNVPILPKYREMASRSAIAL